MRRLTTTEYAVLGLIAFGERSGYDLARGAERSIGAMWAPSRSQIYKVLPRLVDLRCAHVRAVEQETRPDKVLYSITRRGRDALAEWVEEVEKEPAAGASIFLMKIFFGWAAHSPEAAVAQLDAYEAHLEKRLEHYRAIAERLPDDEPVHSQLAIDHATARLSATLSWAVAARSRLAVLVAGLALVLLVQVPKGTALDSCSPRAGDVSLRTADGIRLAAHVFGRGRIGVVLAHQSPGDSCQWTPYARRLARLGYMPLALDFRGSGESATASFAASLRLGGDLAAAVRYLRAHGARKVFLVGASMGGTAVVVGGANIRPPVDGVVAISASNYLIDARPAARALQVPVLYLAGSLDAGAAEQSRQLFHSTRERAKSIVIYDDGRHGIALVGGNRAARTRLETFLRTYANRSP